MTRLSSDGSLAEGLADMGKVAGKRFFLDAYLERALSCPQATFEVDVGNRHLVALYLPGVPTPALEEVKGALAQDFLAAFNLELASIVSDTEVRIEVHEIGVGPTLACGSGSVAVAWAGREGGFLSERVSVLNPGGTLEVALDGDSAWLSGPSRLVAEGVVHLQ
jgi:diaminopimelate epimerase